MRALIEEKVKAFTKELEDCFEKMEGDIHLKIILIANDSKFVTANIEEFEIRDKFKIDLSKR